MSLHHAQIVNDSQENVKSYLSFGAFKHNKRAQRDDAQYIFYAPARYTKYTNSH